MTINVPLLDRIEQQITEHPETWGQQSWFHLPEIPTTPVVTDPPCGTTCCAAGWAVVMSSYALRPNIQSTEGVYCVAPDGEVWLVEKAAQELLGLSARQAAYLFDGDNDLDDLREAFAELRELAAEQAQGGEPR